MLDGVFHADLQGRPDDPAGVRLSWDALLTIVSGEPPETSASRDEVLRAADARPRAPDLGPELHHAAPARARAPSATSSRGEMWEAINTFHLGLLQRNVSAAVQTGPYSVYAYVRERCGLFWGVTGRTMLRDEAHAFLQAGVGDRVRRHGPADAARRAAGRRRRRPRRTCATARRSRCCRPSAASRPTGARVPAPPNAGPVARFLLFERDYPDSVAFSIEALHTALTAADPSYRSSPAVLRLSRLMADLDFRARAAGARRQRSASTLGDVQVELAAGRCRHRPALLWQPRAARRPARRRMNFAIRYLTEYRYERAGHGQPQRAAGQAGDDGDPERRGLRRPRRSRGAPEPAPRLLRHDRDRVRDLAPARAPADRRPRPRADHARPTCRRRPTGRPSRTAPTTPPRASSCCSTAPSPTTWRSTTSSG